MNNNKLDAICAKLSSQLDDRHHDIHQPITIDHQQNNNNIKLNKRKNFCPKALNSLKSTIDTNQVTGMLIKY
jgi:hypothetical protein